MHKIRKAEPQDLSALARLWFDGWTEAHRDHVPEGLTALRTNDAFHTRLINFADLLRMAGTAEEPLGLCAIKENEIDQLYVSPKARGTGLAAELLKDGETRIKNTGAQAALLYCLSKNLPAKRFYEKQGWINSEIKDVPFEVDGTAFPVNCIIFRKTL